MTRREILVLNHYGANLETAHGPLGEVPAGVVTNKLLLGIDPHEESMSYRKWIRVEREFL